MTRAVPNGAEETLAADKAEALRLTPVSRETEIRLDRYVDLLQQWQAKTNLIAPSTLPNLWTRHIANSLQLLSLAPSARRWLDLGSGGGFPESCWLVRWQRRRKRRCISSNATRKKRRFSAKHCASPMLRGSFICRISRILWIVTLPESIVSPPGPWLRYINLSAGRRH